MLCNPPEPDPRTELLAQVKDRLVRDWLRKLLAGEQAPEAAQADRPLVVADSKPEL
jgi:hypothetical protein